jgi:hypothetical protein
LKITVFPDVESRELVDKCKRFEWNCYFHLQIIEVASCTFSGKCQCKYGGWDSSRNMVPIYDTARRHLEGLSIHTNIIILTKLKSVLCYLKYPLL